MVCDANRSIIMLPFVYLVISLHNHSNKCSMQNIMQKCIVCIPVWYQYAKGGLTIEAKLMSAMAMNNVHQVQMFKTTSEDMSCLYLFVVKYSVLVQFGLQVVLQTFEVCLGSLSWSSTNSSRCKPEGVACLWKIGCHFSLVGGQLIAWLDFDWLDWLSRIFLEASITAGLIHGGVILSPACVLTYTHLLLLHISISSDFFQRVYCSSK